MNWWGKTRHQWGGLLGEKELVGSGMLVPAAVNKFAAKAMTDYAAGLVDRKQDSRLEAAICKVFASERGWEIMDDLMQLRGGRGYESSESLAPREEAPPVDQMFVDSRPNRIFEGSTEVLSWYVPREGLDSYLKRGKPFLDKEKGNWGKKIYAAVWFAWRYLKLCFSCSPLPKNLPRKARTDLKFAEKYSRKLARFVIIYSGKHLNELDKIADKQLMIDRMFWIAAELFAMAAVWSYALKNKIFYFGYFDPSTELAKTYCKAAKRLVKFLFSLLRDNDDDHNRIIAKNLLNGRYDSVLELEEEEI